MTRAQRLATLIACVACGFPLIAPATIIEYDVTPDVGNSWMYSYTVSNDTLAEPIDEFTIFFDYTLFADLTVAATPPGWALSFAAQPDVILPHDGFFDAFADPGAGIAPGSVLGGFSVRFNFLGEGTPGAQLFDIVRAADVTTIDSGVTRLREAPTPVPEPATLGLIALGLLCASVALRRRRNATVTPL